MKCLVMALAVALASVAVAQDSQAKRCSAKSFDPVVRAALNPKLAEKIGVTEEQREKLKVLKADKNELKELNQKIRAGMERQAELLKAAKIDEAAVMAAIDEVWAARKEVAKRQTRRLIAVKSILTPEQIGKAREAIKTMRDAKGGAKCDKAGGKAECPRRAKQSRKSAVKE